ncbi:MAG TPA: hypothetical protein VG868_05435, partial [Casimicrobiaceae bacterium]|nr:hypothetical protein [Casimicrobiaceae bacterium]
MDECAAVFAIAWWEGWRERRDQVEELVVISDRYPDRRCELGQGGSGDVGTFPSNDAGGTLVIAQLPCAGAEEEGEDGGEIVRMIVDWRRREEQDGRACGERSESGVAFGGRIARVVRFIEHHQVETSVRQRPSAQRVVGDDVCRCGSAVERIAPHVAERGGCDDDCAACFADERDRDERFAESDFIGEECAAVFGDCASSAVECGLLVWAQRNASDGCRRRLGLLEPEVCDEAAHVGAVADHELV